MVLGATLPPSIVSVIAEMESAAFEGFDKSILASFASARMILRSDNRSRSISGLPIADGSPLSVDDDWQTGESGEFVDSATTKSAATAARSRRCSRQPSDIRIAGSISSRKTSHVDHPLESLKSLKACSVT